MKAKHANTKIGRTGVLGYSFKPIYLALVLLAGGTATADASPAKLIGVWKNDVQNVDCADFAQPLGTPFIGLHTYYSDGNLLQVSYGNPLSGNMSQGRWSKAGKNKYSARTESPRFDVNGFYTGYTIIERMITVAKDGQSLEFNARGSFFSVDDQYLGTSCAVGSGMKVPEPTPF